MNDAVAFMRWERIVPWKILSLKACPDKPPLPVGFGARQKKFYDCLEPGSQIWVVTRVANEFSLAGRVTVQRMLDRNRIAKNRWPEHLADLLEEWPYVAESDPSNSKFFETNCAEPAMSNLGSFTQNKTIIYHDRSLEESFRACMDQSRKPVFLSYRWEEGRRLALALAKEFRRSGFSPWLDAMAIPKYIKKGDPEKNKQRLEKLIQFGIEESMLAVVINTPTFGHTAWTRMELTHIRRKGIRWFQVVPEELECKEPSIVSSEPKVVVHESLRRIGVHG
jgi:hypothetical protein